MRAPFWTFLFALLALHAGALHAQASAPGQPRLARYCSNCATVEAVLLVNDPNKPRHVEVRIRYAKGGTETMRYENDPGLRVGEKVKVNNGVLTRDQ